MRKFLSFVLALAMGVTVLSVGVAIAQAPQTHLKVGDAAPDFTLGSTDGTKVTLSSFQGKNTVVLAFFPAAFTGG